MLAGARAFLLAVALLPLAGCGIDDWLGESKGPPLPGERIAVLVAEDETKPDPQVADRRVILPRPYVNEAWPQAGGYPTNAMYHLAVAPGIQRSWSASIGEGVDLDTRIIPMPLVVRNRVYVMDNAAVVSAYDESTGQRLWRSPLAPKTDDDASLGGGIAFDENIVVAGTGFAQVIALDAGSGGQLWRVRMPGPVRVAPTIARGRVFAVTLDNQTVALDLRTGQELWKHSAGAEAPAMLGIVSAASDGEIVVIPYATGEVFALDAASGRPRWSDSAVSGRRTQAGSGISDIRAKPVIDRDMVFVIGSSDRMIAVDRESGARIWERDIGSLETPWVAGDYLYLVTNNSEIICITRREGLVRWARTLPRYLRPEKRKDPVRWLGPVLASERLMLFGTHGEAWSMSPYDGSLVGAMQLGDPQAVAGVVANGALYVLQNRGRLVTFR